MRAPNDGPKGVGKNRGSIIFFYWLLVVTALSLLLLEYLKIVLLLGFLLSFRFRPNQPINIK